VAQATYTQDTRQLLYFRRALVSFRSRFCAEGRDRFGLHAGKLGYTENPFKTAGKNYYGSMAHFALLAYAANNCFWHGLSV
jgi:hypothetical protein